MKNIRWGDQLVTKKIVILQLSDDKQLMEKGNFSFSKYDEVVIIANFQS